MITNYKDENNIDLGNKLIPKEYLIDMYPNLLGVFRYAGLWTWGDNGYGQLGDNSITHRSSPVQTIAYGANWKSISCGKNQVSAIKTDGTLWTWGAGDNGALGNNAVTHKSSPIQTYAGGSDWYSVSVGQNFIGAIKTDGTLWSWGNNAAGQLGDNSITHRSSPVQTVSGGTNWKLISCGGYHTAAIKIDGTLWTWGANAYGQLGDNSVTSRSSPIQTYASGENWNLISAGYYHTVAIKTDGTLWTWGRNNDGQLGDNSRTSRSSPVQIYGGGTNWKYINVNYHESAAIKTDGTLWLWGHNTYGQLGDNSITHRSSPVQTTAGGTNWKSIAAGKNHSIAIKTDGTLWTWGRNQLGQLGDNSTTAKSSPIQTTVGGTNWKLISAGAYTTVTIRDENDDKL